MEPLERTEMALKETQALMERYRNGDGCALQEFTELHFDKIARVVAREHLNGDIEAAEEITNTAIKDITDKVKAGLRVEKPLYLIRQKAREAAIDECRRRSAQKRTSPGRVRIDDEVTETLTAHEPTEHVKSAVTEAIECLTAEERSVIDCLYYTSRTYPETVNYLGLSLAKVRTIEASALAKMKHQLKDDFERAEDAA